MNKIERRYLQHEVRVASDGDSPSISGYAAMFGVRSEDLGGWVEVINPNAFDDDLASKPDVRALFNHEPSAILGRTISGTLSLSVDNVGLVYNIVPPDTQVARDLMVSMKRGDVNQSSFGFICQDASWGYDEVTGQEIRTVLKAQLFDVSPVTYPAYTDTTSEARSLPADMPVEVRSRIATGVKRDDSQDSQDDECQCDCEQCSADACGICSADDCDDPNCDCQDNRSKKLHALRVALALQETFNAV